MDIHYNRISLFKSKLHKEVAQVFVLIKNDLIKKEGFNLGKRRFTKLRFKYYAPPSLLPQGPKAPSKAKLPIHYLALSHPGNI